MFHLLGLDSFCHLCNLALTDSEQKTASGFQVIFQLFASHDCHSVLQQIDYSVLMLFSDCKCPLAQSYNYNVDQDYYSVVVCKLWSIDFYSLFVQF